MAQSHTAASRSAERGVLDMLFERDAIAAFGLLTDRRSNRHGGRRAIQSRRRAQTSGMPTGEEPSHLAQAFAAARNSRTDSSDWCVYNRCGFFVSHSLHADEQDYRPLLFGEPGESALQIAKLQIRNLRQRERQTWAKLLLFDAGLLARLAANAADMLIVQDRE
jgi:hypothetical protein